MPNTSHDRPDWRADVRARLDALDLDGAREAAIVDELAQHLDDRYADLRSRGLGDADARATVRAELAQHDLASGLAGALSPSERPARARPEPAGAPASGSVFADLWRDLRYGVRSLRSAPGFTAIAVLTLALGIGATTAMFTVLNAVLIRPLPFPAPEQLVRVYRSYDAFERASFSMADFQALQADGRAFTSVATYSIPGDGFTVVAGDRPERVFGTVVSADFFRTLGVRPLLGRTFQAGDDAVGAAPTVVLSHAFWTQRLGADRSVVGRPLNIQGRPVTVIGVMPPEVWFPRSDLAELWVNETLTPPARHGPFGWAVIGRLRAGVTDAQRRAAFAQVAERVRERFPGGAQRWTMLDRPLAEQFSGRLGPALLILMGAVVLVLLIACVNVTNLLLARATSREQEIAVRTSLGASRTRIVRQLLTESALLAGAGALGGVALAAVGTRLLVARAPETLTVLRDLGAGGGLDWRVLAAATLTAIGSVLLFGLAPALLGAPARRGDAGSVLREATRGGSEARARRRLRNGLVAAEFALSLLLLVGAGLLIRSLSNLRAVDPGVRADGVVTASLALPKLRYESPAQVLAFRDRLLDRLQAIPGVQSASVGVGLPPDVFGNSTDFFVSSRPPAPGDFSPIAQTVLADVDYFATLGVPLVSGRAFDSRDNGEAPPTVIVSAALAKQYFPGTDPVGQRLNIGGAGPDNEYAIVGVVGDVRYEGVAHDASVALYLPFAQFTMGGVARGFSVVVRTPIARDDVAALLRAQLRAVDAELSIAQVRTLRDLVEASVAADRFRTTLLGVFAALALVLAAVGIYGVMAYAVGRRAREIGIRLALGAGTRHVYAPVLREGLAIACLGVAVGLGLAFAATRVMAGFLFDVGATDPVTFALVPLVLLGVAVAACVVPARRAARVDPTVTMRAD